MFTSLYQMLCLYVFLDYYTRCMFEGTPRTGVENLGQSPRTGPSDTVGVLKNGVCFNWSPKSC